MPIAPRPPASLSPNTAEGRTRAYDLFGRIFLQGLDAETARSLADVPGLADVLPTPFDADEAAAAFQDLFGLNVFPIASVYIDPQGQAGGVVTEAVQRRFTQAGFATDTSSEGADHIGHELAFLAFLTGAEADARDDGLRREASRISEFQRLFLDTHLLGWLPAFTYALRRQPDPFYARLADLTLELVVDHRSTLPPLPSGDVALPEPPNVLADPKTGLHDIARFLMRHVWSGLALTRRDLALLGRSERIPRGFGDRTRMLEQLLRSAADYDRLPAVLAGLRALAEADLEAYAALSSSGVPTVERIAARWVSRLEGTKDLVGRLEQAVASS